MLHSFNYCFKEQSDDSTQQTTKPKRGSTRLRRSVNVSNLLPEITEQLTDDSTEVSSGRLYLVIHWLFITLSNPSHWSTWLYIVLVC